MTTAAGSPFATSRAKVGPERTQVGKTAATDCSTTPWEGRRRVFALDSFGGGDEHHFGGVVVAGFVVELAGVVGGHDSEDDLGVVESLLEAGGGADGRGDWDAGEEDVVFAGGGDAGGEVGFAEPEADFGEFGREDDGEGGSPASAS